MFENPNETYLTLREIADVLPRVGGKKIHLSTLHRWTIHGARGVKLETVRLGSRVLTSREAVGRFVAALSALPPRARPRRAVPEPRATSATRQREIEAAERRLIAAGC